MRRREFITLLGGTAAAWPLAARGQQVAVPVIGFLQPGSPAESGHFAAAFLKGLKDTGFGESDNLRVEYRWAEGQYERLPRLAENLVRLNVRVIVHRRTARNPCREVGDTDHSDRLHHWR
jgi:putative ABC transport system substrate-binding protein